MINASDDSSHSEPGPYDIQESLLMTNGTLSYEDGG